MINDLIYFLVTLISYLHPARSEDALALVYPYAHYLFNMSVCCTAWLTVAVATERYMLVRGGACVKGGFMLEGRC